MKIVKNCNKHGDLTEKDCFIRTEKRWGRTPKSDYSCKFCKKESSDKYRLDPARREVLRLKQKLSRVKGKEKAKVTKKIWISKNRNKINEVEKLRRERNIDRTREYLRNIQKKWRDNLDDNYIKSQLKAKYKIKQKDIPQWMIDIKRPIIQLRRKIRELKGQK